jgi:hypothetical protein
MAEKTQTFYKIVELILFDYCFVHQQNNILVKISGVQMKSWGGVGNRQLLCFFKA